MNNYPSVTNNYFTNIKEPIGNISTDYTSLIIGLGGAVIGSILTAFFTYYLSEKNEYIKTNEKNLEKLEALLITLSKLKYKIECVVRELKAVANAYPEADIQKHAEDEYYKLTGYYGYKISNITIEPEELLIFFENKLNNSYENIFALIKNWESSQLKFDKFLELKHNINKEIDLDFSIKFANTTIKSLISSSKKSTNDGLKILLKIDEIISLINKKIEDQKNSKWKICYIFSKYNKINTMLNVDDMDDLDAD